MMTLDEAITHCEEVVERCDKEYMEHPEQLGHIDMYYSLKKCADDYNQLAEWLKELKRLREHL